MIMARYEQDPITHDARGFTLVELLVAVTIGMVVMAGIYSTYFSQQKSGRANEQLTGLQQNLRVAMFFMEREIRMAGCDPSGQANARIITAQAQTLRFTEDINGDGDTNDSDEDITYSLYDSSGDGDNDLGRAVGGSTRQPIAENIDALDFQYLDASGSVTATVASIRSVQITVVARADRADPEYRDTDSYTNLQGDTILAAQNDGFRRRRLACEIKCRNLGLGQ